MEQRCRVRAGRIALALCVVLACGEAAAQGYPTRPITMIVPFAAGGPTDVLGRALAAAMGKALGQTVVVENIGGAGGNIGVTRVAKAAPDGYTVLLQNYGMAFAPALYSKLDYNPLTDFDYVGLVSYAPSAFLARRDFPAATLSEAIAYIRAHPDKLAIANTGPGGPSHLCATLFMKATGTRMVSVPYRGSSLATNDLMARQVDLLCDSVTTATPHIQAGSVRTFGVTSKTRFSLLPDVPTLDEQGLRGFELVAWMGVYTPRGVARAVRDRLVVALQEAIEDADFRANLAKLGNTAMAKERATPEALETHLRNETAKWGAIIRDAGIALQ